MNSLFDKVLIREQMKRYWSLGVLNFLVYLLFILMPLWNTDTNPAHTVLGILSLRNPLILIANIIAPLAAATLMFSHMYKPSAAVAVYTMPFTKKKLFASNALAGFLLIAIPLFIFSVLLLVYKVENHFLWDSKGMVLNEIPYGSTINTVTNVTMFFLRTLLSFIFYYILFITAAMIVGNQVMHLIVSALLAFIAVIVKLGFDIGASYYIFGYYADMSLMVQILFYTNPILIGAWEGDVENSIQTSYYISYIIIMIALIIFSAWLHQKRRLECTADMVVFAPIKQFLVFIMSVTGMIYMGAFFHLLFYGGMLIIYAGFIVGFILAFYIAQMIIEKSFNVFYRMKWVVIHGLTVLAIMTLFNAINVLNIGGYVKYVPKAEDVYGVYLQSADNFIEHGANEAMLIQEPFIIEQTILAHEMIIDNRRDLRKTFINYMTGQYRKGVRTQYITYMLKNGAIVTREYALSQDIFERSGMEALLNEKTSLLSDIFWVKNPQLVESINMIMYEVEKDETDENSYTDVYVYNGATLPIYIQGIEHTEALAEAIKEDYLISVDVVQRSDRDKLDFLQIEVDLLSNDGYEYVGLYYYENTLKCLSENGYSFTSHED